MTILGKLAGKKETKPSKIESPKPPEKEAIKEPPKPKYPILRRGSMLYGDIVELEDHLTIGVYVRDDGTWAGGETHSKMIWRKEHGGRLPWEENTDTESYDGILMASIRGL